MIPLIDDYIQSIIIKRIRFLKENPQIIDYIFQSGNATTNQRLKDLLTTQKLRCVIGYPREQTSLPAYVITLAPEDEQPSGLGDNIHTYGQSGLGMDDGIDQIAQLYIEDFIASTFMNSNYRIECWSDNGDLTAYMYCILKWCLWSARKEMLSLGWNNIKISGTDLEPVPDYMPVFIYRRAAQLSMTYDNKYHEDLDDMVKYLEIIANPENYSKDESGNIINVEGEIIIPSKHSFQFRSIIQPSNTKLVSKFEVPIHFSTLSSLPEEGSVGTLYLQQIKNPDDSVRYQPMTWNPTINSYQVSITHPTYYDSIVVLNI